MSIDLTNVGVLVRMQSKRSSVQVQRKYGTTGTAYANAEKIDCVLLVAILMILHAGKILNFISPYVCHGFLSNNNIISSALCQNRESAKSTFQEIAF